MCFKPQKVLKCQVQAKKWILPEVCCSCLFLWGAFPVWSDPGTAGGTWAGAAVSSALTWDKSLQLTAYQGVKGASESKSQTLQDETSFANFLWIVIVGRWHELQVKYLHLGPACFLSCSYHIGGSGVVLIFFLLNSAKLKLPRWSELLVQLKNVTTSFQIWEWLQKLMARVLKTTIKKSL